MKMIITDTDTKEEKTIILRGPRPNQFLSDETIRNRREYAIDCVILEALKFTESDKKDSLQFIASPNHPQIMEETVRELELIEDSIFHSLIPFPPFPVHQFPVHH